MCVNSIDVISLRFCGCLKTYFPFLFIYIYVIHLYKLKCQAFESSEIMHFIPIFFLLFEDTSWKQTIVISQGIKLLKYQTTPCCLFKFTFTPVILFIFAVEKGFWDSITDQQPNMHDEH